MEEDRAADALAVVGDRGVGLSHLQRRHTHEQTAEPDRRLSLVDRREDAEAMRDVGPGGHFFGTQHTLDRYETAFYEPIVSDWRNFEAWEAAGAPDAQRRANTICKKMLAAYQPPPLDSAIAEQLADFVARRKEEIGVRARWPPRSRGCSRYWLILVSIDRCI